MRQAKPVLRVVLRGTVLAALLAPAARLDPHLAATACAADGVPGTSRSVYPAVLGRDVAPPDEADAARSRLQLTEFARTAAQDEEQSDRDRLMADVAIVKDGDSSRDTREDAERALPMTLLAPRDAQRVRQIVSRTTLFRRLPTVAIETEADVYEFFMAHPDVAVAIWRAMDISNFQMRQTHPATFFADAGDGTSGTVEVIFRDRNEIVALCEGQYRPNLPVKPIRALAMIHVESMHRTNQAGKPETTHRVDLFVAFPSQTVKMAARIVSPISNVIMDRNFIEISRFVRMMSVAMEIRPGWVEFIGNQLQGVAPADKTGFLNTAARVYVAARKRNLAEAMQTHAISLEKIMAPIQDGTGRDADPTHATPAPPPLPRTAEQPTQRN